MCTSLCFCRRLRFRPTRSGAMSCLMAVPASRCAGGWRHTLRDTSCCCTGGIPPAPPGRRRAPLRSPAAGRQAARHPRQTHAPAPPTLPLGSALSWLLLLAASAQRQAVANACVEGVAERPPHRRQRLALQSKPLMRPLLESAILLLPAYRLAGRFVGIRCYRHPCPPSLGVPGAPCCSFRPGTHHTSWLRQSRRVSLFRHPLAAGAASRSSPAPSSFPPCVRARWLPR